MLIALPIILVHGGAVQIHTNWHDWDVKLLIAAWVNTFKTNLKDTTKTDIKVLSNANIAPLFVRRNLWWYRDWPVPVTALSKAWVCGRSTAGIAGSNTAGGGGLERFVCCQVEVSETGRSLIRRSPTDCDVPECYRGTLTIRRAWPTRGCPAMKKINISKVTVNRLIYHRESLFTDFHGAKLGWHYIGVLTVF